MIRKSLIVLLSRLLAVNETSWYPGLADLKVHVMMIPLELNTVRVAADACAGARTMLLPSATRIAKGATKASFSEAMDTLIIPPQFSSSSITLTFEDNL